MKIINAIKPTIPTFTVAYGGAYGDSRVEIPNAYDMVALTAIAKNKAKVAVYARNDDDEIIYDSEIPLFEIELEEEKFTEQDIEYQNTIIDFVVFADCDVNENGDFVLDEVIFEKLSAL